MIGKKRGVHSCVCFKVRRHFVQSHYSYCHIETVARDGMLRSKFLTGLFSQQLKQSLRHLFDSIKNFESLLREIRNIQEEITAHRSIGSTKSSKQAFIHAGRAEASTTSTDLQKELQTITRTTERLEQKIDNNSKSF